MKETRYIFFTIITCFLLSSCNKEKEYAKDDSAIRYRYFNLQDKGWKSLKYMHDVDGISFTATEVPLQYYILKDVGNTDLFEVDSIYQANNRERVIEFEFSQKEQKDLLKEEFTKMDYAEGVKYMSFGIEKDFYAVTSKKDTITCSGITFERNFKVAPYHKLILFFTNIDPDDKIQLIYEDHLFNKGTLKFRFKENITKLIL